MVKDLVKVKCKIFWCFHNKPAAMSGKYESVLTNLSQDAVKVLQDDEITVRTREDRPEWGSYIVVKSKLPLNVEDSEGNKIDKPIGNGSEGIAVLGSYKWSYGQNKDKKSPSLNLLVVTDLKEYETMAEFVKNESHPVL